MLPTLLQKLTLQEAFETITQMNEKLNRMEFDGLLICAKKSNFYSLNFLHFLVQSALLGWLWGLPATKALRR